MSLLHMSTVTRSDLISALLGERPKSNRTMPVADAVQLGWEEVGLLYQNERASSPSALVVHQGALADMFAWLDTYAPQFSPITQYCRVVSAEGARLYAAGRVIRGDLRLIRALAGVVVGEVLAQTSNAATRSLEGVTLSHAQATFSLCLARSEMLRNAGVDFRSGVVSNLDTLWRMRVFPERLLTTKEVVPFWSVAFGLPENGVPHSEVGRLLSDAVRELMVSSLSSSTVVRLARHYEPARELMMLQTYSAEDRVKSFDRLSTKVGTAPSDEARAIEDFCLAYAAVEIGGGSTRHAGLLQEYGERRPLVWLWFGLLSSIGEGDKWHPAFARIARLVQRELEYSFDPWDPPRADIALDEFLSMQHVSSRSSWLAQLPRAHARVLAVEVSPGVPFQFSIGSVERREAPVDRPMVDITRLDEAMSVLWGFRQSLVSNSKESSSAQTKGAKRAKSGRAKKDSLF